MRYMRSRGVGFVCSTKSHAGVQYACSIDSHAVVNMYTLLRVVHVPQGSNTGISHRECHVSTPPHSARILAFPTENVMYLPRPTAVEY